jgi:hypothetical protein
MLFNDTSNLTSKRNEKDYVRWTGKIHEVAVVAYFKLELQPWHRWCEKNHKNFRAERIQANTRTWFFLSTSETHRTFKGDLIM